MTAVTSTQDEATIDFTQPRPLAYFEKTGKWTRLLLDIIDGIATGQAEVNMLYPLGVLNSRNGAHTTVLRMKADDGLPELSDGWRFEVHAETNSDGVTSTVWGGVVTDSDSDSTTDS